MTAEEFFKNNLDYDLEFLDTLMKTYKKEMKDIALRFMNTNSDTISAQQLAIPNEICDFLDNNGFTLRYEGSNVYITRLHPKKYVAGGWVEYTPETTPPPSSVPPVTTPLIDWEDLVEKVSIGSSDYTIYNMPIKINGTSLSGTWSGSTGVFDSPYSASISSVSSTTNGDSVTYAYN